MMATFADWVGREEQQHDVIDAQRAHRLRALLDRPYAELTVGTALPPGYHWLYCLPLTPRSQLGADGHPRRGGFLPLFPGARRMWAGGSLEFLQPLHIGEAIERHSVIASIEEKHGRAGPFHLVRVAHRFMSAAGIAVEEEQHLVYLPTTRPVTGMAPTVTGQLGWQESFVADEVVLFFFSALTMNGHRIHYDQPYATSDEGYPGLLVHAPLSALLLLDAAHRRGQSARRFEYRALAPLFCHDVITLAGQAQSDGSLALWALRPDASIAVQARLQS